LLSLIVTLLSPASLALGNISWDTDGVSVSIVPRSPIESPATSRRLTPGFGAPAGAAAVDPLQLRGPCLEGETHGGYGPGKCSAWVRERQEFRYGETGQVYTRIQTSGQLETADSNPWQVEWSGNLDLEEVPSLQGRADEVELPGSSVSRVSVSREVEGLGGFRAGRYTPEELPAVGPLDACQGELQLGRAVRAGVILGLRPDADATDPSAERPLSAAYVSTRLGSGTVSYSGTLGLVGTVYDGKLDRTACLVSQSARLGPKLTLQSCSEIDVQSPESGGDSSPLELTRIRLQAVSPVTRSLTLRAGIGRQSVPETLETRDRQDSTGDPLPGQGTWQHWIGSSQRLPWNLTTEEEVSFLAGAASTDMAIESWQVSVTRMGIPGLPLGRIRLQLSGMDNEELDSFAGRVAGEFPLLDGQLSLRPSVGLGLADAPDEPRDVKLRDVALFVQLRAGTRVAVFGSAFHHFADAEDRPVFEFGVRCTF
jgi:hypothetical protein